MLLALALACQPYVEGGPPECDASIPAAGEVRADDVLCTDELIGLGEGRTSDTRLANAHYSAIIRHPNASLTLLSAGGGTVIDAAAWGVNDSVLEIAPIVGGGWLNTDLFEIEADGVRVGGVAVALPDGLPADGERHEIRWSSKPDDPWLYIDGAEGLWIHLSGDHAVHDSHIVAGNSVFAHDGTNVDLGGAIRAVGATRLLIATTSTAWSILGDTPLSGTAPGATSLRLFRDQTEVGRVPLDATGSFDLSVPNWVDAVRAEAGGFAPSDTVDVADGLELTIGAPGRVELRMSSPAPGDEPLVLTWDSDDGRGGRGAIHPDGAFLSAGAGVFELAITGGPQLETWRSRAEIGPDEAVQLGVALQTQLEVGDFVAARLEAPSDRAWNWRGGNTRAALDSLEEGAGFVVFAPEGEVGNASAAAIGFPELPFRNGSTVRSPDGWRIVSWPWSSAAGQQGHGAAAIDDRTPAEMLASVLGSKTTRIAAVDLNWLAAVGPPWTVSPPPDLVLLDRPPTDGAWNDWFAWLDAGLAVVPTGPTTWVRVPDRDRYAETDVEQGLIRGDVIASTGPQLRMSVDGVRPGEIAEPARHPRLVHIEVHGGSELDTLVVYGDGGAEVLPLQPADTLDLTTVLEWDGRWLALAGWSDDGQTWAVTGPVWTAPP